MLIYIHGFNSSPASFKARLIGERLRALGRETEYLTPELPHRPARAMDALETLMRRHPQAALIGSSLGGYYATWLAEKHGVRAALLNPAVRPYALFAAHLGPQKNLYTGKAYELTPRHVEELRVLELESLTPRHYYLLTCTGDETLDYRDGVARYRGARQLVIEGGDHGMSDFARHMDDVLNFCGIPTA
jgi:predicted esterase YcpF (UPF0227 family)